MTEPIETEPIEIEAELIVEELVPHDGPEPAAPLTVEQLRHAAYTAPGGPDSIFMKWQRGDEGVGEADWRAAAQAIRDQYPHEESP